MKLKGKLVDGQTRCEHYHGPLDIIAIKFPCCDTYYPCFSCHQELAGHEGARWPSFRFHEKAVLCGACGCELTVREYLSSGYACPCCSASFNPRCGLHAHLYFEVQENAGSDD